MDLGGDVPNRQTVISNTVNTKNKRIVYHILYVYMSHVYHISSIDLPIPYMYSDNIPCEGYWHDTL